MDFKARLRTDSRVEAASGCPFNRVFNVNLLKGKTTCRNWFLGDGSACCVPAPASEWTAVRQPGSRFISGNGGTGRRNRPKTLYQFRPAMQNAAELPMTIYFSADCRFTPREKTPPFSREFYLQDLINLDRAGAPKQGMQPGDRFEFPDGISGKLPMDQTRLRPVTKLTIRMITATTSRM